MGSTSELIHRIDTLTKQPVMSADKSDKVESELNVQDIMQEIQDPDFSVRIDKLELSVDFSNKFKYCVDNIIKAQHDEFSIKPDVRRSLFEYILNTSLDITLSDLYSVSSGYVHYIESKCKCVTQIFDFITIDDVHIILHV
jgi:hypothetical protein